MLSSTDPRASFRLVAAAAALLLSLAVHAGPPLVTDDTGIVDVGGWEFIVSVAGESRDEGDSYDAPAAEVSYGIADNMQVTAAISRQIDDPAGESSRSDFGYGGVQWKWRFYENNGFALAVGPGYQFPVDSSSKKRGIIDDVRVLSLPLIGSYTTGDWEFTAQVSYDLTSVSDDGVFYGTWAGYSLTDRLTLLAEIYGEEVVGESEGVTNWRVGLEYGLGDIGTLLLGFGGGIRSDLPDEAELDYDFFVGYQYDTG
jgi:hypothetical protein